MKDWFSVRKSFIRENRIDSITTLLIIFTLSCGVMVKYPSDNVYAYDVNNDFISDAFPGEVSSRVFSIPLVPGEVMVVYPRAVESRVEELQMLLSKKCGTMMPFFMADDLREEDLHGKHLIVIGNISNNPWVLELYKRRYAFSDTYFPGKGGVFIHPASSLWDSEKNVLVIGVSSDNDNFMGFETFVELLGDGVKTIETIHYLKTSHTLPEPPGSVEPILDRVMENLRTEMAPYATIANWGLLYFLSGDKRWAEHFRDGFYLCYKRAEKSGQWIPEQWTNVYFQLSKMIMAWELIDDDPFFTMDDRKIIDEVIWGYTRFCRWLPNLDKHLAPPREPRQNHTTFLALSLYRAYWYFTEKYGITGLDSMVEKIRLAFDNGQAHSYMPNDDAGIGYYYYAPLHLLTYNMAEGDDSFLATGRMRSFIDLMVATIDNRGDGVGFGDVGGFSHRTEKSPAGRDFQFFEMAAWYYGDSQYKWLSNRMTKGSRFNVELMYNGIYAVDIKEEMPIRYFGVFPVTPDESTLRWSAMRSWKKSEFPFKNEQYFNKISFRTSFDPEDEYLLLDGFSTFSHGHHDGNTVTRLTWKDRIWLFDIDYIKFTPKYHNGVTIVCDGVQDAPPPLNVLDYAADFNSFGFTRTTSKDFSGADWERNIIWKKGEYFIFLDRVTALNNGYYRLESRWRTRGDVVLTGNVLSVHQGDKSFYIKSADETPRTIEIQHDGYASSWNYPYGDNKLSICLARKNIAMSKNSDWTFANLLYAEDNSDVQPKEFYRISENLYMVNNSENRELIGLCPDELSEEGVYTDCSLFVQDSGNIRLLDTSYMKFKDVYFEAPANVHIEIDYRKSTGQLIVPEGSGGTFMVRNLTIKGVKAERGREDNVVKLGSGTYIFTFKGDLWKKSEPFTVLRAAARRILPEFPCDKVVDFGIDLLREFDFDDTVTAFCPERDKLICADNKGRVTQYDVNNSYVMFRIPSEHPIVCVHASDIDGDRLEEIIAGDNNANIYCYDTSGKQLWTHIMRPYRGDASAVDITVGDIDGSGKNTVLVTTKSWKLYAFNPDGTVRWDSFIFYHPLTKVGILKNDNGKTYIAVGTVYHTPLNVVSPVDGKVIWKAWEEMGSEFIASTDYCGIHLTDMLFVDTDHDGEKEIVFGTKYNRVYALNAKDGSTEWEANVGDEVTVMKEIDDPPTGEKRIVVATEAGDLIMLDRTGKRLDMISFGSGISDMETIAYAEQGRNDIIVSTRDSRIIICDDDFLIRASFTVRNASLKGFIMGGKSGEAHLIYCVSDKKIYVMKYLPYFVRKSRHY